TPPLFTLFPYTTLFRSILKKELLRIPFFGWGLATTRPIAIDRSNPVQALKDVKKKGLARLQQGNNLLIFPEGTRIPLGQVGNYRSEEHTSELQSRENLV